MRLGFFISLGLAAAALVTGLSTTPAGSTAAAQAAPRACTADDFAGTKTGIPLKLMDPAIGDFPDNGPTVTRPSSGHRYAAVVDDTLATREQTTTKGSSILWRAVST